MRRAPAVDVPTEPYDPSLGLPGLIVPDGRNQHFSIGTLTVAARVARFVRFLCPRSMTIGSIAFEVTAGAGANDGIDCGIYGEDLTTLLRSSGEVLGLMNSGAGIKTVTLTAPLTLEAGRVYHASIASPTPGWSTAAIRAASFGGDPAAELFGATPALRYSQATTAIGVYPLANNPGSVSRNASAPLLGLRTV
jgi:hypothetical protein